MRPLRSNSLIMKRILLFVVFLVLIVSLQWRNRAYTVGFGSHPDEPAHYVTGMLVYKYLTSGFDATPMQFAERFMPIIR